MIRDDKNVSTPDAKRIRLQGNHHTSRSNKRKDTKKIEEQ